MGARCVLLLLAFVSSVLCYSGEFVPKSYYVIDHNGHKSNIVYFRSKRDVELFPLLRMRRGGGSSSSSQSSAQASSNSGSGAGGGGGGGGFPGGSDYIKGFIDSGFDSLFDPDFFQKFGGPGGGGSGGAGAYSSSFASSSSSSSSGFPGQGGFGGVGGVGGGDGHGYNGPILFSRFGEDTGTGVNVGASAQGPKGAFSASSSSIDSDGKIKYSVQSGKY